MPPQPGPEMRIEDQLFAAMDKAALVMIEVLTSDEKTGEGDATRDKYDLKTKMAVFTQAQDWLSRRPKLRPADTTSETEGVDRLRTLMGSPTEMVDHILDDPTCEAELMRRGWTRPGPAPRASKTPIERREREAKARETRSDADDDSKLSRMIGKTTS